jgi:hypothetical protein
MRIVLASGSVFEFPDAVEITETGQFVILTDGNQAEIARFVRSEVAGQVPIAARMHVVWAKL